MTHDPKQTQKDAKSIGVALVEEFPGGGALRALLSAASNRNRERKFDQFADGLVQAMGLADQVELFTLIEQHQDEDWCVEGVEEGFRTVLSSMDPTARKCATLLVADYLKCHDVPDRVYRQFASLFSEADSTILGIIAAISDAAVRAGGIFYCFFHRQLGPGLSICIGRNPERLEGEISLEDFAACCGILQRNNLASTWNGAALPGVGTAGQEINKREIDKLQGAIIKMQVERYQRPLWDRLRTYLGPVRPGWGKPVT